MLKVRRQKLQKESESLKLSKMELGEANEGKKRCRTRGTNLLGWILCCGHVHICHNFSELFLTKNVTIKQRGCGEAV